MVDLRLHDVELRFLRPLQTGAGTFASRRSVLVSAEGDGVTGWGEAPAMPSGAWGTIDEIWDALAAGSPGDTGPAAAGLRAAIADHSARVAGTALCRWLGGSVRPVIARLTTGLADDPATLVARVDALAASGATAVKIKIAPGRDVAHLGAVRAAHPALAISADANGGYRDPDDPVFAALDRLGVDLVEQPLPPGDLAGLAALRLRLEARVCVDEEIRSVEDAERVLAAGAADVLSLKPMRLGLETARAILARCRDAGVAVKAGGTFDTAIGRHHVLAFATLDGVVEAEAGPPGAFLEAALADYPPFVDGCITPYDRPGIGVEPDPASLAAAVRTTMVR